MQFMDEDFLLSNETAKTLYHQYAKKMPIVDYHCHVNPREIAENKSFDNITQVWLSGDHYKWRMIRCNGVDEKYITGDSTDREKFQAFAEALARAIGNPLYHWTHLELKRYFDCDLVLGPDTAEEIWNLCNKKLRSGSMTVRDIIKQSRVTTICTTDDPTDSLEWHKIMAEDHSWDIQVLPAFRPDKALNADKAGFPQYITSLADIWGKPIATLDDVTAALSSRIDFFHAAGCRASDHGVDYVPFQLDRACAEKALANALKGESLTPRELDCYKTAILLHLGREYAKRGWVMQLHYGAQRSVNPAMFRQLGPDTGFDCISTRDCSQGITGFLGALSGENQLPKTVLYSLNPCDDALLASVAGCFQGVEAPSKIQHGSAWWFNDTKTGMRAQMTNLANLGVLGNFIGMLTDSRSFLSYTRHEYFRRILCDLLGGWVENGEYPDNLALLGGLVQDISYNNAMRYFGFGGK